MPSNKPTTNSSMPDRLYGEHYPDSFLDVPQPVRTTRVATLGDYIQQLREVSDKPNQRDESCFACKPSESHQCPNNSILTCNCADDKFCAEQPNDNGWFTCPDSGKLCNILTCPDGCKGDKPTKTSAPTTTASPTTSTTSVTPTPAPKGKTQSAVGLVLSLEVFVKPGLVQPSVFVEPSLVQGLPNEWVMQDSVMSLMFQPTIKQHLEPQDLGFEQ